MDWPSTVFSVTILGLGSQEVLVAVPFSSLGHPVTAPMNRSPRGWSVTEGDGRGGKWPSALWEEQSAPRLSQGSWQLCPMRHLLASEGSRSTRGLLPGWTAGRVWQGAGLLLLEDQGFCCGARNAWAASPPRAGGGQGLGEVQAAGSQPHFNTALQSVLAGQVCMAASQH